MNLHDAECLRRAPGRRDAGRVDAPRGGRARLEDPVPRSAAGGDPPAARRTCVVRSDGPRPLIALRRRSRHQMSHERKTLTKKNTARRARAPGGLVPRPTRVAHRGGDTRPSRTAPPPRRRSPPSSRRPCPSRRCRVRPLACPGNTVGARSSRAPGPVAATPDSRPTAAKRSARARIFTEDTPLGPSGSRRASDLRRAREPPRRLRRETTMRTNIP